MLVGKTDSDSLIIRNEKQNRASQITLTSCLSHWPRVHPGGVHVPVALVARTDLPLSWCTVAVIIGIITLLIIRSAVSIIIVLNTREAQRHSENFLQKNHYVFSSFC